MMLLNGYLKGMLSEGIATNMRNKLFSHIQNLSFSYHNNVAPLMNGMFNQQTNGVHYSKVNIPSLIIILFDESNPSF